VRSEAEPARSSWEPQALRPAWLAKKYFQCEAAHTPFFTARTNFRAGFGSAPGCRAAWRTIMSRTELAWWSAARIEIDHRAREARLRLEQLERRVLLHVLPPQPWLRWRRYRLGPRFFGGGREQSRSTRTAATGAQRGQSGELPTKVCAPASGLAAKVTAAIGGVVAWPSAA
jgi:hypothetical protein